MEHKPKRRTRERILELSLDRFNTVGESNVTTSEIAELLNISPGNLYYHFANKEAIVEALFDNFRHQVAEELAIDVDGQATLENLWLYLHLVFELSWKYRFLYRDPVNVVSRYTGVANRMKQVIGLQARSLVSLLSGLAATGELRVDERQLQTLVVNMMVIATHWLSFEYVREPRKAPDSESMASGVYHVMSLISPLLSDDAREAFEGVALRYV